MQRSVRSASQASSLGDTITDDPKENRPAEVAHHFPSAGGISGLAVFGCCLGYCVSVRLRQELLTRSVSPVDHLGGDEPFAY